MLLRLISFLALLGIGTLTAKPAINPAQVAILYNSAMPESEKLAQFYAEQRNIPKANLVGLELSSKGHISREKYQKTLKEPLRKHFTEKMWWKLGTSTDGIKIPVRNQIRLIVCMYGVPYGIKQQAIPKEQVAKKHITQKSNSASVDSELALLGIDGISIQGAIPNRYFKKNASFASIRELTPFMMVGRIDGPSYEVSKRLITDAIETEKQGLWGMCYIDHALKGKGYQLGDDWMTSIEQFNWKKGIPCTVDKNKQTYLTNYPMREVALYYGWYTSTVNGPFLNPDFRFKRGAIAIHLHSFSARNIRNPKSGWVGPLLNKGAAATVGNVFEPYLGMTHYFDILNARLIEGYSFIEAASMSVPVLSWQNLAVGDPLFRPFIHFDGLGAIKEEDKLYRSIRYDIDMLNADPQKISAKLRKNALATDDPRYFEILGLYTQHNGDIPRAIGYYLKAQMHFPELSDKIRMSLHQANAYRLLKQKHKAVEILQKDLITMDGDPAAEAAKSMIKILQPPPPPAAQPREQKPQPTKKKNS